ncbi:MAG: hypothetical protein U0414_36635 [Polyangiaceae bacterium]
MLHRTTRALRPTTMGERLLGASRAIVAELAELERSRGAVGKEPEARTDPRVRAVVEAATKWGATQRW